MSERWCKLYPHALTDPLWLAVADDAGTSPGLVGATFVELLTWTTEHAADAGSIAGFDPRVWAAWLRIAPEAVERIIASLRKFGRIAGDRIVNWAKRQGAAAVAAVAALSTPRTRRFRARQRDRRQGEMLLPISGTRERVPTVPDAVSDTHGNASETANRHGISIGSTGNALDIERERDLSDSLLTSHAVGGTRQSKDPRKEERNLRALGTNPRALGINPRALAEKEREARQAAQAAEWRDLMAREHHAGLWDETRFAPHVMERIVRREIEIYGFAAKGRAAAAA